MYEAIIGLEIHLQVKTKSKMFCDCVAEYFESVPNSHTCPVCLGLPGALPYANEEAIRQTIKLALALGCSINKESKFDRKNYFYPDLPKGYQISQYDLPIGYEGFLEIDLEGDARRIRITRVHLEEDTGKSLHDGKETLLDYNKSGIALIEVVTEPDFKEVKEVLLFARRLQQIVRYLEVSNGDMEKGQMRFELNMSLREQGTSKWPNYKVEVKNIGSISVLEKVVAYEFERQSKLLDQGETPLQETRGLRDLSGKTYSQRIKEDADDYRYFPEPDLPPLQFSEEELAAIEEELIELPNQKKSRYIHDFKLEPDSAEVLVSDKEVALWFEAAIEGVEDNDLIAETSKWLIGDVFGYIKADKVNLSEIKIKPKQLLKLVELMKQNKISGSIAKRVLEKMYATGQDPETIIEEEGLSVVTETSELEGIIDSVIAENNKVVSDIDKNPNAIKFLLGQVMQKTKGAADPNKSREILEEKLL